MLFLFPSVRLINKKFSSLSLSFDGRGIGQFGGTEDNSLGEIEDAPTNKNAYLATRDCQAVSVVQPRERATSMT